MVESYCNLNWKQLTNPFNQTLTTKQRNIITPHTRSTLTKSHMTCKVKGF